MVKNKARNTMNGLYSNFPQIWKDMVRDVIIFNSSTRVEMSDQATYEPVGQGTEVCMMKFLQGNDYPIYDLVRDRKEGKVLFTIPHSSDRKRMTSVCEVPEDSEKVRVVVKGAPELLIENCVRTLSDGVDGYAIQTLEQSDKEILVDNYLNGEWTNYKVENGVGRGNAFRSILYAYRDINKADFVNHMQTTNNFAQAVDKEWLESDLTLVAVFALHNPLREKANTAVTVGKRGHLQIRMVTGDSEGTARAVALQAGILTDADFKNPNSMMSGAMFKEAVKGYKNAVTEDGRAIIKVGDTDKFADIAKHLRVIYRGTADDKLALTIGLRAWKDAETGHGHSVAVTGEGVNDESALKLADVGISMGASGCDLAKDASAIILTDDNFMNTVKCAMWGRNIYQNIRKFLQFQVTMNISCCLVVFLGGLTLGVSPFGLVQLLLINLVMDMFAALALATEPPRTRALRGKPVKDGDAIMTNAMWTQIFGQGVYIALVTLIILWAGPAFYNAPAGYGTAPATTIRAEPTGDDAPKSLGEVQGETVLMVHTMAFNTFMFMHFFNQFCCRKVNVYEWNMFERFFNNPLFLIVMLI